MIGRSLQQRSRPSTGLWHPRQACVRQLVLLSLGATTALQQFYALFLFLGNVPCHLKVAKKLAAQAVRDGCCVADRSGQPCNGSKLNVMQCFDGFGQDCPIMLLRHGCHGTDTVTVDSGGCKIRQLLLRGMASVMPSVPGCWLWQSQVQTQQWSRLKNATIMLIGGRRGCILERY